MSFNDPIAEMLTRIRNAVLAKHRYVDLYISKVRIAIVKILKEQGFIADYLIDDEKRMMRIFFKYSKDRKSVIRGIRRISSPGLRRYVSYKDIPYVVSGLGIALVSTSLGILDDKTARVKKVGGEVLCYVW